MSTVVVGPYSIDDKEDAKILAYFAKQTNKSAAFRDAMNQAIANISTLENVANAVTEIQKQLDRIECRIKAGIIAVQNDEQSTGDADVLSKLDSLFGE